MGLTSRDVSRSGSSSGSRGPRQIKKGLLQQFHILANQIYARHRIITERLSSTFSALLNSVTVTLRFTAFLKLKIFGLKPKSKRALFLGSVRYSDDTNTEEWRFCWKNVPKLSPSHAPSFLHVTEVRGSILRWRRIVTHVGWW